MEATLTRRGSTTAPLIIMIVIVGLGVTGWMFGAPSMTVDAYQQGVRETRTATYANSLYTFMFENYVEEAMDYNIWASSYGLAKVGGGERFMRWEPEAQANGIGIPTPEEMEAELESNATDRMEEKYLHSQSLGEGELSVPPVEYEINNRTDVFDGKVLTQLTNSLHLLFIMDTSGSMSDDWDDVCSIRSEVEDRLEDEGISTTISVYGLTETQDCADQALNEAPVDHLEDWGPGITWAANSYGWGGGADVKIVFPMSDECPQDGDGCNSADENAIDTAKSAAQSENVRVYPIWGSGTGSAAQDLMEEVATATGGSANPKGNQEELTQTIVNAGRVIEEQQVNNGGSFNYTSWISDLASMEFTKQSGRTQNYLTERVKNNDSMGNRYFYQYNMTRTLTKSEGFRHIISKAAMNASHYAVADRERNEGECNDPECSEQESPQSVTTFSWNNDLKENFLNKQEPIMQEDLRSQIVNYVDTFETEFRDAQGNSEQYQSLTMHVGKVGLEYEIDNGDVNRVDEVRNNEDIQGKGWVVSDCAYSGECGCPDCPDQECSSSSWDGGFSTSDYSRERSIWTENPWYLIERWDDRSTDEYDDQFEFIAGGGGQQAPTMVSRLADSLARTRGAPMTRFVAEDNECEPDPYYNDVIQRGRNVWWFDAITAKVMVEIYVTDRTYFAPTGDGLKHMNFTIEYEQHQTAEFDEDEFDEVNYEDDDVEYEWGILPLS